MALASRGLVLLPAIAVDSLMNFYMLCVALGEEPFARANEVVSQTIGARVLSMLRDLIYACGSHCLEMNPIAVWETMSSSDEAAYCPFAYGYSNYARAGYAKHSIDFGGLVTVNGTLLRSTLGGAGLAISKSCREPTVAAHYAAFVASDAVQRGIYFESGGQPGLRTAWTDMDVNKRSGDFFSNTLETLDRAYLRPRFDGYLTFQEEAGEVVHQYLSRRGNEQSALKEMNEIFIRAHKQVMEAGT
jgi:multiple sugar transport system substrate-binding protein